jgi:hypothetical protein
MYHCSDCIIVFRDRQNQQIQLVALFVFLIIADLNETESGHLEERTKRNSKIENVNGRIEPVYFNLSFFTF